MVMRLIRREDRKRIDIKALGLHAEFAEMAKDETPSTDASSVTQIE